MFLKILESVAVRKSGKNLVDPQLSEAREIADMLVSRIEQKLETLRSLESSIDEKICRFEMLLKRSEEKRIPLGDDSRLNEIVTLYNRGLKIDEIAAILDMPAGEVELVLNLNSARE